MTEALASWETAADPGRRVGRGVEFHPTIGSTNDRARALLATGEREGIAVVADLQTAGRGRHGRSWASPAGRNLLVSVGLRLTIPASDAWMLSAAAALALRDACSEQLGASPSGLALKWPNDLVDADGRKIAGILLETTLAGDHLHAAVIGAGVNVNWPRSEMPPEIRDRAIALCDLAGHVVERVALLAGYLRALDARVGAIEAGESPIAAYRAASWLDGRTARIAAGADELVGTVAGIGADGTLVLDTLSGVVRLGHGEVLRVGPEADRLAP